MSNLEVGQKLYKKVSQEYLEYEVVKLGNKYHQVRLVSYPDTNVTRIYYRPEFGLYLDDNKYSKSEFLTENQVYNYRILIELSEVLDKLKKLSLHPSYFSPRNLSLDSTDLHVMLEHSKNILGTLR